MFDAANIGKISKYRLTIQHFRLTKRVLLVDFFDFEPK